MAYRVTDGYEPMLLREAAYDGYVITRDIPAVALAGPEDDIECALDPAACEERNKKRKQRQLIYTGLVVGGAVLVAAALSGRLF